MSNVKRTLALITCVGIILFLFSSSAYITHEADHTCVGDHCEVCRCIEEVRAILHSFALMTIAVLLVLAVLALHRSALLADGWSLYAPCTLVSLKVRLNN